MEREGTSTRKSLLFFEEHVVNEKVFLVMLANFQISSSNLELIFFSFLSHSSHYK